MSNNIYDILKKMQGLEQPKSVITEAAKGCKVCGMKNCKCEDKKHESKKKDKVKESAIAEAVAQVEQQLNEKYMGFKKKLGEAQVNELSPATLTSYADKAKGQRGWAFGRAKAGKEGHGSADPQGKFDRLWNKRADGYNQAVAKGARDLDKSGQKSSWDWSKDDTPAALKRDKGMAEGEANEDALTPKQKKFAKLAPPPDKITYADKIAGAKQGMKKEGNAFSGAMAKAKATGANEFKVGGKEYKVQEDKDSKKPWPSKEDAKKRMDDKEGKTTHGKKTSTKSGTKHERDWDKHDSEKATGDDKKKTRGRPKKDKFA